MKSKFTYIYSAFVLVAAVVVLTSSSGGRNDNRAGTATGEGNCSSCHAGGAGTTTVSLGIAGSPAYFSKNATYNLTLTVSNTDISMLKAGFQIVARDGANNIVGTFTPGTGSRTAGSTNRLTHSTPQALSSGTTSWTFSWKAPATSTGNIRFYYSGNAVNGDGGTSDDVAAVGSTPGSPLPATLIKFSGHMTNNQAQLTWQTATESNVAHYVIERSKNGSSYQKIGKVDAAGNSNTLQKYNFVDENPLTGNNYYRIRTNDNDGKFEYSPIIKIKVVNKGTQIYPNITTPNSTVQLVGNYGENAQLRLINLQGRLIASLPISTENQVQMPASLSAGIYYLCIGEDKMAIVIQ